MNKDAIFNTISKDRYLILNQFDQGVFNTAYNTGNYFYLIVLTYHEIKIYIQL